MADQQKKYEILITNGTVIDPANGLNGRLDVAVNAGRIAAVAPALSQTDAVRVIDVRGALGAL